MTTKPIYAGCAVALTAFLIWEGARMDRRAQAITTATTGALAAVAELPAKIDALPVAVLPPLTNALNSAVNESSLRVKETMDVVDRRTGDTLSTIRDFRTVADARIASIQAQADGVRADLKPVIANAATLTANYAALPDRIAYELRPSWLAIQPEITCRTLQGDGYGGCLHGRVNALAGEWTRVGGVFAQQFPAMAGSVNGIAGNVNSITRGIDQRWIHPPPRTRLQKVWGFIEDFAPVGARVYGGAR